MVIVFELAQKLVHTFCSFPFISLSFSIELHKFSSKNSSTTCLVILSLSTLIIKIQQFQNFCRNAWLQKLYNQVDFIAIPSCNSVYRIVVVLYLSWCLYHRWIADDYPPFCCIYNSQSSKWPSVFSLTFLPSYLCKCSCSSSKML